MYDADELTDEVRGVIAISFGIDEMELPENASQATFTLWSSLRHVTLLIALEEHFATSFSMDEMLRMTSLGEIIAVLKQHRIQ